MSEPTPGRDFTFSVTGDKIDKIRDTDVPDGTMVAPGLESVSPEGRFVTQRAMSMVEGLFRFAERSHEKDPADRTEPAQNAHCQ